MSSIIQLIVAVGAVAVFLWLLMGNTPSTKNTIQNSNELINPNDSRQLATLIGLAGGDISDAAVARFAIQRFQEQYGRAANTRDIGTIIGIMRSL
jgi:hypothetical protein